MTDTPEPSPLCFVVGPIGQEGSETRKKADMLFAYVIEPALSKRYRIERADKDAPSGLVTPRIMRALNEAHLIVADLSGLNANALYELGIVHALSKRVIHVTDDLGTLPFDLKDFNTLVFDVMDPSNHRVLAQRMQDMDSAMTLDESVTNPFTFAVSGRTRTVGRDEVLTTTVNELVERVAALELVFRALGTGYVRTSPTSISGGQESTTGGGYRGMLSDMFDTSPPRGERE